MSTQAQKLLFWCLICFFCWLLSFASYQKSQCFLAGIAAGTAIWPTAFALFALADWLVEP